MNQSEPEPASIFGGGGGELFSAWPSFGDEEATATSSFNWNEEEDELELLMDDSPMAGSIIAPPPPPPPPPQPIIKKTVSHKKVSHKRKVPESREDEKKSKRARDTTTTTATATAASMASDSQQLIDYQQRVRELRSIWSDAIQSRFQMVERMTLELEAVKRQYRYDLAHFRFQMQRLVHMGMQMQEHETLAAASASASASVAPLLDVPPSLTLDLAPPNPPHFWPIPMPMPTPPREVELEVKENNKDTAAKPFIVEPPPVTAPADEPVAPPQDNNQVNLVALDKESLVEFLQEQLRLCVARPPPPPSQQNQTEPELDSDLQDAPAVVTAAAPTTNRKKKGRHPRVTIVKSKVDELCSEEERAGIMAQMPIQLPIGVHADYKNRRISFQLDWDSQLGTTICLRLLTIDGLALSEEAQVYFNSFSRAYQMSVSYLMGAVQQDTSGMDKCYIELQGKQYTVGALKVLASRKACPLFVNPNHGSSDANMHFGNALIEKTVEPLPDVWKERVPNLSRPKANPAGVKQPRPTTVAVAAAAAPAS